MLILKHLKILKTLQHISISIQIIFRELVVSSLKTEFKIARNIKGPLWQCGSIRVVQLASPHRTPYIHTTRMLPHCHNCPFIFLVILNSVTLTRKIRAPEDDLNRHRNMLERFKYF